jgi:hypothetical protein
VTVPCGTWPGSLATCPQHARRPQPPSEQSACQGRRGIMRLMHCRPAIVRGGGLRHARDASCRTVSAPRHAVCGRACTSWKGCHCQQPRSSALAAVHHEHARLQVHMGTLRAGCMQRVLVVENHGPLCLQGRAARRAARRAGSQADQGGRGAGGAGRAGQNAVSGEGVARRSVIATIRAGSGSGLKARRPLSACVCWGVSTDAPASAVDGSAGPW